MPKWYADFSVIPIILTIALGAGTIILILMMRKLGSGKSNQIWMPQGQMQDVNQQCD